MILTYNNKLANLSGHLRDYSPSPIILPPFTLRLKFGDGITPSFSKGTAVQVLSSPNIWDLTYENTDWSFLLSDSNVRQVLAANSTGVTNMRGMFYQATVLTAVPILDTSSVTDMSIMFYTCTTLISEIPLYDTSNVTNMDEMFRECMFIKSGALALYRQASTQATVPSHYHTFLNCGRYTTTGAAELAQIPDSWK